MRELAEQACVGALARRREGQDDSASPKGIKKVPIGQSSVHMAHVKLPLETGDDITHQGIEARMYAQGSVRIGHFEDVPGRYPKSIAAWEMTHQLAHFLGYCYH